MRNIITLLSSVAAMGISCQVLAQANNYTFSNAPSVEINLDSLDKRSQDIAIPQAVDASKEAKPVADRIPATVNTSKQSNMFDEALPGKSPDKKLSTSPDTTKQFPMAAEVAPAVAVPVEKENSVVAEPAAQGSAYSPFKRSGYVEAGGNYSHLNNNYGSWIGEYVKGEIQTDSKNRWNAEIDNQKEFGSDGVYGVIGNTHQFNEDWYSVVDIGAGSNAFFLPELRIDAFINRKLLPDKRLVATLGVGYSKAQETYDDKSVFVGATYYFPRLWVVQGGVRYNYSNPGGVDSTSAFVAVTEGEDKKHFVTLRYGFGKEAYQIIGPSSAISDFNSNITSLDWRQWVVDRWGFDLRGEYYHNPNYDRNGINFGVFHEF